jgi:Flp pilus assembly protein TadB
MCAWWPQEDKQKQRQRTRKSFAVTIAAVAAVGSVSFPSLAMLSQNPIVGALQETASFLLLPGIIGAMAISGNVHGFSFWVAAPINAAVYFGLAWLAYRLAKPRKSNPAPRVS